MTQRKCIMRSVLKISGRVVLISYKVQQNGRREDQAERSHCSLHVHNLYAGQSWRMVDSLLHYTPASRGGTQQSVCSHRPSFPWLEPTAVTGASKHKHDLRKKTPPIHQQSRIWSFSYHLGQTLIFVNEEKVLPHQHFVELHEKWVYTSLLQCLIKKKIVYKRALWWCYPSHSFSLFLYFLKLN